MMRQRICGLVLLALIPGPCGLDRRPVGAPGTIQSQRLDAVIHDPYTDNDLGPEVVGGRPREFQVPLEDADRSQRVSRRRAGL